MLSKKLRMILSLSLVFLFVIFSILSLLVFHKTQEKYKILLFFSLLFYVFIAKSAFLLIFTFSILVFFAGKYLHKLPSKFQYFSIVFLCLIPLLAEKIFLNSKFQTTSYFTLIGVSYISFNGLSYLFDIKKGYLKPETNFYLLLLYLFYFPYISIGPLHRYRQVISQFKDNISLSNKNFSEGFRLILWGLFKNMVLAQRLNIIVEIIFNDTKTYQGFSVFVGGFAFFLYLYCDFSSYIDIFQGISRIFGIQLKPNFRIRVYASSSRKHFWEGWHITLNHWFRDYFFFPLSRNFRTKWQTNLLVILTFLLIALWHEISIKFLIWGILNACWILSENHFKPKFDFISSKIREPLGIIYHLIIASFLAIIFRTDDLFASIKALFSSNNLSIFDDWVIMKQFLFILPLFLMMDFVHRKAGEKSIDVYIGTLGFVQRWAFYGTLISIILMIGIPSGYNAYYLRF